MQKTRALKQARRRTPAFGRASLAGGIASLVLVACGGDGGGDSGAAGQTSQAPKPSAVIAAGSTPSGPGTALRFDGSGSRAASGGSLSYRWTLSRRPPESVAALDRQDGDSVMFTPDLPGEYALSLVVSENNRLSEVATQVIVVPNPDPVVMVMGEKLRSVAQYTQVMLDAGQTVPPTGVDPSQLRYHWRLLSEPEGLPRTQLEQADTAKPYFVAYKLGAYQVQLEVEHDGRRSAPVVLDIVANQLNQTPVAMVKGVTPSANNTWLEMKGKVGERVTLDGSGSYDPDGDPLQHSWYSLLNAFPVASQVKLENPTRAVASFVPDFPGHYSFRYVVNDGTVATRELQVAVLVEPNGEPQKAPVLVEQPYRFTYDGRPIEYECERGSDRCFSISVDGNSNTGREGIQYNWTYWNRNNPAQKMSVQGGADGYFPDVEKLLQENGVWEFEIYGEKGGLRSNTVTRTLRVKTGANVPPSALARSTVENAVVGSRIPMVLNRDSSTATYDENGDPLTIHWSISEQPEGSQAQLIAANDGETAMLIPDKPGLYAVDVTAVDPGGLWSTNERSVTQMVKARNTPPVVGEGVFHTVWNLVGGQFTAQQPAIVGYEYSSAVPILDPDNDPLHILTFNRIGPDGMRRDFRINYPDGLRVSATNTGTGRSGFNRGAVVDTDADGMSCFSLLISDYIDNVTRNNICTPVVKESDFPTLLFKNNLNGLHYLLPTPKLGPAYGTFYGGYFNKFHNPQPVNGLIERTSYSLRAFDRDYTVRIERSGKEIIKIEGLVDGQVIKKGEEVGFIVGRVKIPWDDAEAPCQHNTRVCNEMALRDYLSVLAEYPSAVRIGFDEKPEWFIDFDVRATRNYEVLCKSIKIGELVKYSNECL